MKLPRWNNIIIISSIIIMIIMKNNLAVQGKEKAWTPYQSKDPNLIQPASARKKRENCRRQKERADLANKYARA